MKPPFPSTGGVFAVAAAHPSGALHIYALPSFTLVWKSYDLYEDRPLLLHEPGDLKDDVDESIGALAEAEAEANAEVGAEQGDDAPPAKRIKTEAGADATSQAIVAAAPKRGTVAGGVAVEADEPYAVEIRFDDFGRQRHSRGPLLTVRRADGTVELFTAFVAPATALPSGAGAFPLRFQKHPRAGEDAGIAPACAVGDAEPIDPFLVAARRRGGAKAEAALSLPPSPRLVRFDGVGRDTLKQHPLGLYGVFVCSKHRPYWALCMRGGRMRWIAAR